MSSSSASVTGQPSPSPSPQAQPKAQNVLRKPIRRPVSGSSSSQPSSPQSTIPQTSTVPASACSASPAFELAGSYSQGMMQTKESDSVTSESMSQRSSISESPSYNGAQSDNALSSCKLCNHCKSGISYDVPYYRCRFCQFYVCNSCHGAHPSSHESSMVRMLSRRTMPDATRFEKSCCQCLKPVHCRHDCQECSICFCDECFLSKEGSHEHSSFNTSEAPSHHLKISDDVQNQECCTTPVISHCSRCSSSIGPAQYAFMCKTCLFKFDATVKLCQPCYTESWYLHDQTHECITVVRQPLSDDAQTRLVCSQCNGTFPSLNRMTLDQHPHNAYVSYMGPRAREAAAHTAYRSCPRKRFREDQPQVTLECARCKLEFPEDTMRVCAGPCEGTLCDQCFPQASLNHIHGPSNFRSTSDEARPEIGFLPAGWRALKNTEGRIYYLQDQTKKFTFDKPQVPNTLPAGWTSMLDSHGKPYYLDHNTRSATYVSPVYGIAPAGYELRLTNTGRLYYVNRKTQAATWHKPLPINEKLPAGWEAGQHADGRVYYINHVSKTTQWTKPTSPALPPRHTSSASHQVMPIRTSAGHAPATAGSAPTRPSGQANRPINPAPHQAKPATHATSPTAASIGHATAGPRPGNPVHRPASTAFAGQAPASQHAASGTHAGAPGHRPSMPQKVASAPAATNLANMRSSLNALARNPKAQKVALGLGLSAFTAAVAPDLNLGNMDLSGVDFGGTSTDLGSTDFGITDFGSTDTGTSVEDSSSTTPAQDSNLGATYEPVVLQSNEVLDVQDLSTESYLVAADSQSAEATTGWAADTSQTQYSYTTDSLSPASMSTSAISPPLMSPGGWTDPAGSDASYMQNQGQTSYTATILIGNDGLQQQQNSAPQNPQHQNPAMRRPQPRNPAMRKPQPQNPATHSAQHQNPATHHAQHQNPATHHAQHQNPPTHHAQHQNPPTHHAQHQNPPTHHAQHQNPATHHAQHQNPATHNAQHQNPQHQNPPTHNAQHQNPQHQNPPTHNAQHQNPQHQNPPTHNAQPQNPPTHNAQHQNPAMYNAQPQNPAMYNAYDPGNKPTDFQISISNSQQDYQAINYQSTDYTTGGTDNQANSMTQTGTVVVTDIYDSPQDTETIYVDTTTHDSSQGTETIYVDTTTYTIEDEGNIDTVDYSFVSSQDLSSNS